MRQALEQASSPLNSVLSTMPSPSQPPSKPRASVFLAAAQRIHAYKVGDATNWLTPDEDTNMFCCTALSDAGGGWGSPEEPMLRDLFEPKTHGTGWWKPLRGQAHDYESRILALLLCAEMVKGPVRRRRARKP